MKTNRVTFHRPSGFSLLEILATIAIIAALLLAAIPMISSTVEQSEDSAGLTNARHLAEMANLAISAGSEPLLAATTKEEAVSLLQSGVYGDGQFAGTRFQVAVGQKDLGAALNRLSFSQGVLTLAQP